MNKGEGQGAAPNSGGNFPAGSCLLLCKVVYAFYKALLYAGGPFFLGPPLAGSKCAGATKSCRHRPNRKQPAAAATSREDRW